jgi:hypothetical protein
VTMATPSFGTYYLAQTATGVALPVSQVVAAAPATASPAPSAGSSDARPSDRLLSMPLIESQSPGYSPFAQPHCRDIFWRGRSRASRFWTYVRTCSDTLFASLLPITASVSFLVWKVCCGTSSPILKPENNTATAAWSKQQSLEMQPQASSRDVSFGQLLSFYFAHAWLTCTHS